MECSVLATALNTKFATAHVDHDCGIVALYTVTVFFLTFSGTSSGDTFTFVSTAKYLAPVRLKVCQNSATSYAST